MINVLTSPDENKAVDRMERANSAPVPTRSSRAKIPCRGVNSARFAEKHKRLYADVPSIADDKEKLVSKHQEKMSRVPDIFNRLARRSGTPKTPLVIDFNVDEGSYGKTKSAQKPVQLSANKRRFDNGRSRSQENVTGMKQAKISAPIKDLSNRIDQLAAPKSANKSLTISPRRRSYTPNRSPYRYVDTTKMSDSQFRAYERRQKEEQQRQSLEKKELF